LNAIQNIGSLAAYPFAPYLSDGIGRRLSIFFGAFIMVGATILQTASKNVGMFIGARFLIGFGLTFAANAAPMLVTEIAYPVYRAPLTSLYNSLWYSGAIMFVYPLFSSAFTVLNLYFLVRLGLRTARSRLTVAGPGAPPPLCRGSRRCCKSA
jgi:MFS family permease